MYNRKIIETKDGSSSIYVEELGETFHSIHGAIQEAKHVYIQNGLLYCLDKRLFKKIEILEMGFGTGLNAFLTCLQSKNKQIKIHYTAIEAYPIKREEWKQLTYPATEEELEMFEKLHTAEWNKPVEIHSNFILTKVQSTFEQFESENTFDLVYFDVFGYNYQPHLWSEEIFQKMYNMLKINGVLVTYACKGVVNRTMKSVGFEVEKLVGPPGKREMTRAEKINEL